MKNYKADPINYFNTWENLFNDVDKHYMNSIIEEEKLILKYQKKYIQVKLLHILLMQYWNTILILS